MENFGLIIFLGESGKQYEFTVYPINNTFNPNISCVYFVTERTKEFAGGYSHTKIYVGETADLSERFNNHHKQDCFNRYNANCICIYLESSEIKRFEIEQDLIDNYNPPCNG